MNDDLVYGISVSATTIGVVQVIKEGAGDYLPPRLYPVLALAIAILLTVALKVGNGEGFTVNAVAAGVGYGLVAAGAFSAVKAMTQPA